MSLDVGKQAIINTDPGTIVVKTERDDENGVLIYSAEFSNGNEVHIDNQPRRYYEHRVRR